MQLKARGLLRSVVFSSCWVLTSLSTLACFPPGVVSPTSTGRMSLAHFSGGPHSHCAELRFQEDCKCQGEIAFWQTLHPSGYVSGNFRGPLYLATSVCLCVGRRCVVHCHNYMVAIYVNLVHVQLYRSVINIFRKVIFIAKIMFCVSGKCQMYGLQVTSKAL